jgi:hypothetical protein
MTTLNNKNNNKENIFDIIGEAIYKYKIKDALNIIDKLSISDIFTIKHPYHGTNIFLYICDKIRTSNRDYTLPVFHKILSKFLENPDDRKELLNTVDKHKNNWLQIILTNNNTEVKSDYEINSIKNILYHINSYKDTTNIASIISSNNTYRGKYNTDLTNLNNINIYGNNVLLDICNNPVFNDFIKWYLIKNININHQNKNGSTALILAADKHSNLELIKILLDYDYDKKENKPNDKKKNELNVNLTDKYTDNVLITLAEYKYIKPQSEINQNRYRELYNISRAYNSNSNTEYNSSNNNSNNEAKNKPQNKPENKPQNKPENTIPLVESIVYKLIDKGIDIKYKTKEGNDALTYAIKYNNTVIFKALLNHLIKTDKEYLLKTIKQAIDDNLASTNIIEYYDSEISLNSRLKYNSNIFPKLTPITDIAIKYGVELEICVKLDKKCIGKDINTNEIIYSHRGGANTIIPLLEKPTEWIDLVNIYLYSYIKLRVQNNAHLKNILKKAAAKYRYIIISNTPKNKNYHYIYDLNTLKIIHLEEPRKIDYTKPIITTDVSVICGDYKYLEDTDFINGYKNLNDKNIEAINNTFHIEFVTPILTAEPITGRKSMVYDLEPLKELFELIGMDKKDCYISNKSQGLHVNLSLVNKNTNKTIPLLQQFFKEEFFPKYIEWEKTAYPKYRLFESTYAKPLHSFITPETYASSYSTILYNKYVSLHRKGTDGLIEVRLFASSNNYKELISRSQEAIGLLYASYEKWYNSRKETYYKKNTTRKKGASNHNSNNTSKPIRVGNEKRNKTRYKRK